MQNGLNLDNIKAFVVWADAKQRYMFKVTRNNEPVAIGWDTTEDGAHRQAKKYIAANYPEFLSKMEDKSE